MHLPVNGNRRSRWKRSRQPGKPFYRKKRGLTTTWRDRYNRMQKFLAKKIKNDWESLGFRNIRVLDLGCGILENASGKYSPTAENLIRLLEINRVPVGSFVAVDFNADNRIHRGITYKTGDVRELIGQQLGLKPNVIVINRVLSYLGLNDSYLARPATKKFVALCWEKLPEKGIIMTGLHLLGEKTWPIYDWKGMEIDRKVTAVPILVQKIGGAPKILSVDINEEVAGRFGMEKAALLKKIFKEFKDPSQIEIIINGV